jgi:transcriptional regulator with XRE-family HTH domain
VHFGTLLRRLRTERGLTQAELASRAGVSELTISVGERSDRFQWRRTTANDVYFALEEVAPINDVDSEAYLAAAGMSPDLLSNIRRSMPADQREDAAVARALGAAERLARSVGADRLLGVLEGIALAWGIAGLIESAGPSTPVRGVRRKEMIDGHRVTIVEPAAPASPAPTAPAPPPPAKPARHTRRAI